MSSSGACSEALKPGSELLIYSSIRETSSPHCKRLRIFLPARFPFLHLCVRCDLRARLLFSVREYLAFCAGEQIGQRRIPIDSALSDSASMTCGNDKPAYNVKGSEEQPPS